MPLPTLSRFHKLTMAVEASKSWCDFYDDECKRETASKKNQWHSEIKNSNSLGHVGHNSDVPSSDGQSSSFIQRGNIVPSAKASPTKSSSSSFGISKVSASLVNNEPKHLLQQKVLIDVKKITESVKHHAKDKCEDLADDVPLCARSKMNSDHGDNAVLVLSSGDSYDDDTNPLSTKLYRKCNLGTCSSNYDHSVRKKPISEVQNVSQNGSGANNKQEKPSTLLGKRPPDKSNFLNSSVKKSMVTKSDPAASINTKPVLGESDDELPVSQRMKKLATLYKRQAKVNKCGSPSYKRQAKKSKRSTEGLEYSILSSELDFKVKELAWVKKSIEKCQMKRLDEQKRLHTIERDIDKCFRELETKKKQVASIQGQLSSMKKQFEGRVMMELDSKEKQFEGRLKDLKLKEKQLEGRVKELETIEEHLEGWEKELKSKGKQFEGRVKELESKEKQFEGRVKDIESKENNFEERVKELESKEKQFEGRVKELESKERELESKERQFEGRVKELESIEEHLEGWEKELKSKEKKFEGRVMELESKEKQLEGRVKELESIEEHLEGWEKELKSKGKQFEGRVKELESKEKQFEGQVKDIESKENNFEERVKELESKEKQFEGRVKELESKDNKFEDRVKELESKEKQFEDRVKELESKENQFEMQVKGLNSKKNQFERQVKELEFKEKQFEVQVKELEFKEKQFEGQAKDLESKQNQLEGQLKELELKEKHYEALVKSFEAQKVPDKQLSLTTDGRSLQLQSNVQTHETLSISDNDVLVNLKTSPDPAKLVLDIIQNPILPRCRKEGNAVIFDRYQIFLLEQLMRLSPHIEPHVRDEAMKLALDLEANTRTSTENSAVVLGFLLLLSIYGLVSYFNEDEVLKLFKFVAEHKQAVEMFRTLGFVDKVSDFVQSLIQNQQHIEAVGFICAYKLVDKYQPVDLLREYVQHERLIYESSYKKVKSIEIKVKAIDQEIASLESVQQCISDNNIESQDLHKEIQDRILELQRQFRSQFINQRLMFDV